MAWLEGSETRDYEIDAPLDDVVDFFGNPDAFEDCLADLETLEKVGEGSWKFTLEEIAAKGISFQGEYTVDYERDGDVVTWSSDEEGNMKSEGRMEAEHVGDEQTRVQYEETISVELPIPKLMTKVFNPIVDREVSKGINHMLDCAKETLESGAA